MKKLYIIGDAECEIAPGCRISESQIAGDNERIWGTLSTEKPEVFTDSLDAKFHDHIIAKWHYNRSPQVVLAHLMWAGRNEPAAGVEYTLELFDIFYQQGFTTTIIKRATPTKPLS